MHEFKSKLEKRWSNVFTELGMTYEYEARECEVRVHLQKKKYLPDFFFPKQDLYVEVKAPHKWEGHGLEKARALASQNQRVVVCKENGKFFFLGDRITGGGIYRCPDCNSYFFSADAYCSKCVFCNSSYPSLYASGENGLPHWYNSDQNKWLFDETEYQKSFNSTDAHADEIENIHNHLEGVPEVITYTPEIRGKLDDLFKKYPNMEEFKKFIYAYIETLELRNDKKISFQPILLVGSPGCGKTAFATEFAQIIMDRIPVKLEMGNGITNFDLVGSSPGFTNSQCGKILKSMFSESPKPPIKNPIIVIDEFEKNTRDKYCCETAFYTLFEKKSSEIFTDCFFGVPIDASEINYIATANSVEGVSKPILNRMKVFYIRDYTDTELKNIVIQNIYKEWIKKENIKRDRIPKVLSSEIVEKVIANSQGELRRMYSIFTDLLSEYQYFDEDIQEYISLFPKKDIPNWQNLTDNVEFENDEWFLKPKDPILDIKSSFEDNIAKDDDKFDPIAFLENYQTEDAKP